MIYLDRFKFTPDSTFGAMVTDMGHQVCFTVELPWLDNEHDVSCIPNGVYQVEQFTSPKHGDVWKVMNVPGRTNIEIHPANLASELLGCIGVGDSLGKVRGIPAVMNSQNTFVKLKSTLPDSFQLTITGDYL